MTVNRVWQSTCSNVKSSTWHRSKRRLRTSSWPCKGRWMHER